MQIEQPDTPVRQIRVAALMLYPYGNIPGQRFRIEQWEPLLSEKGISIDYYSFADQQLVEVLPKPGHIQGKLAGLARGFARRLGHVTRLRGYDAVILYRAAAIVGPAILERLVRLAGRPIIYDFDDAIFLTDTAKANAAFGWAKFAGKTASICKLSSAVTVGNSYLADYARRYNPNVFVVPTSVDTDLLVPRKRARESGRIVVGWVGSSTSQTYLEAFEPTLAQLLKHRDVEIRVVSDRVPAFRSIPFVWEPWTREREVEQIAAFDIGIMPMTDDAWARGKCAFKALQYMSLAIPAICGDVGANRDVIENGVNGRLASTLEEWLDAFVSLIDDASLRREYGDRGRETIVERYSMTGSASGFATAIIETVNRARGR